MKDSPGLHSLNFGWEVSPNYAACAGGSSESNTVSRDYMGRSFMHSVFHLNEATDYVLFCGLVHV